MISSIFPSSSFLKNKIYNLLFDTYTPNNCIACGSIYDKQNNQHNLGGYYLCSEECNKNYYIDILCSSK